ncbi:carbonic anhydrase [Ammoniphilus sp. CFH 90114]|uniref:carbonic anhydrase n=1 Tax=Ammoniphilus sp. CFH 90114 TaxID=2493665 RepID=UPI00100E8771|nr:carbonic anhydrase [Ammoniphilus sp. CFH 90114]RXT05250.1 carbonic anhydrase [Ammoniphilus sp. CFH 90114]
MKAKNKWIVGSSIALFAGQLVGSWLLNKNKNIQENTETTFNLNKDYPTIHPSSYIHPHASVIGQVHIGQTVFIAPFVSIRGDEGLKIHIGNRSNVQDGVVVHGLKNFEYGGNIGQNSVFVDDEPYSVHIGERVTLAHQSQVHGPTRVEQDVFIGMQALVFNSYIEEGAVLEPGCRVIDVTIPKNRYVSAGRIITNQAEADRLPEITPDYRYYNFNQRVTDVNQELASGYRGQ